MKGHKMEVIKLGYPKKRNLIFSLKNRLNYTKVTKPKGNQRLSQVGPESGTKIHFTDSFQEKFKISQS